MPVDPVPRFFDANILLYVASRDEAKANRAEQLLVEGGTISVQVLNEIANVSRRKMRMSWDETRAFVERFSLLLNVVPVTLDIHENGLRLAERYQLSVYDAMIVSAALKTGCHTLVSEDMHPGLKVDGQLTVLNPFAGI